MKLLQIKIMKEARGLYLRRLMKGDISRSYYFKKIGQIEKAEMRAAHNELRKQLEASMEMPA